MVPRNRITKEALQSCYDSLPPTLNETQKSLALACAVLRGFLGAEWFDRHVMPTKRKPEFLTIKEDDLASLSISYHRIMDLAEVLYNLQNISGFDECIYKMRKGDIEGTYAELDFGRMLYLHQIHFRYVIPVGITGKDYDVDILYPNGVVACGDGQEV